MLASSRKRVATIGVLLAAAVALLLTHNGSPPAASSEDTLSGPTEKDLHWGPLGPPQPSQNQGGQQPQATDDALRRARAVLERASPSGDLYWSETQVLMGGNRFVLINRPAPGGGLETYLVDTATSSIRSQLDNDTFIVNVYKTIFLIRDSSILYYQQDKADWTPIREAELPIGSTYNRTDKYPFMPSLSVAGECLALNVFRSGESGSGNGSEPSETASRQIGSRHVCAPRN